MQTLSNILLRSAGTALLLWGLAACSAPMASKSPAGAYPSLLPFDQLPSSAPATEGEETARALDARAAALRARAARLRAATP